MGAFDNILNRGRLRSANLALVAALLLGSASVAAAGPPEGRLDARSSGPIVNATAETEASVSTSPIALGATGPFERATAPRSHRETMPLTRAASQQRVEEMSPMAWLARYGAVTVGRTE